MKLQIVEIAPNSHFRSRSWVDPDIQLKAADYWSLLMIIGGIGKTICNCNTNAISDQTKTFHNDTSGGGDT